LFLPSDRRRDRPAPVCLCKRIGNLEQLLNDVRLKDCAGVQCPRARHSRRHGSRAGASPSRRRSSAPFGPTSLNFDASCVRLAEATGLGSEKTPLNQLGAYGYEADSLATSADSRKSARARLNCPLYVLAADRRQPPEARGSRTTFLKKNPPLATGLSLGR